MKALALSLEAHTPLEVIERCYPNGRLGGLVLDGPAPGDLGQPCRVTVHFADGRHFDVRGQLSWARHRGNRSLKECFGVDFVAGDEAGVNRLMQYAQGMIQSREGRKDRRLLSNLPVKITFGGQTRKESLFDLSLGGAFVRTPDPLPFGSLLVFRVRVPASLRSVRLTGRVAWVRGGGTPAGMGVQFYYEKPEQTEKVARLLEKLR